MYDASMCTYVGNSPLGGKGVFALIDMSVGTMIHQSEDIDISSVYNTEYEWWWYELS